MTIRGHGCVVARGKMMSDRYEQILVTGDLVTWNIGRDQVGFRYPDTLLDHFDTVTGVYVQPGTTAIILDGEQETILKGGVHPLVSVRKSAGSKSSSPTNTEVGGFFARFRKSKQVQTAQKQDKKAGADGAGQSRRPVTGHRTIAQVRDGSFAVTLQLPDVQTADGITDLHLRALARVSDIRAFYQQCLIDHHEYTVEDLSRHLRERADGKLRNLLAKQPLSYLGGARNLAEIEADVLKSLESVRSWGISVESIEASAVRNETQDRLRSADLELQQKERELDQAIARAKYIEKLSEAERARAVADREGEAEIAKALEAIERDELLSRQDAERFRRGLELQKQISDAKSNAERDEALQQVKKSGLLKQHQYDAFARLVERREKRDVHLIDLLKINQQQEIERLQAEFRDSLEIESLEHKKRVALLRAESDVEARRIHEEYEDSRRAIEQQQLLAKQQDQLTVLEAAQRIRLEREQAEHERELARMRLAGEQEQERLKTFGTMSADQIMAANPGITDEAARALAEIGRGRSREETLGMIREILETKNRDMQQFMDSQMAFTREVLASERHKEEVARYVEFLESQSSVRAPSSTPERQQRVSVCPACSKSTPNGARFCPYCGAQLSVDQSG